MCTSLGSSMLFALLGLRAFMPTEITASDLCANPSSIRTVDTVDFTKEETDYYYCYSSLTGSTVNNCYIHMKPVDNQTTDVKVFVYNVSTNAVVSDGFTLKMDGNPGIYQFTNAGPRQATGFVTDMSRDQKCVTYFKCFTGGPWGGSQSTGHYAAIVCKHRKNCKDPKYSCMVDNIKANLLSANEELKKLDQEKCRSMGIEPRT